MSKDDIITSTATTRNVETRATKPNRRSKRKNDIGRSVYKKKTVKEEILSSFLLLKVIRRIARGILIAFTWYVCNFYLVVTFSDEM